MTIHQATPAWPGRLAGALVAFAATALVTAIPLPAAAQTSAAKPASAASKTAVAKQPQFESPQAAIDALVAALRANDAKQLARLLGPGHQRIVDSGDSAADREAWARFVADYDAKHALQLTGEAKATLVTGANDWPMPIPVVKTAGGWVFDASAGEEEIIARRIGRNELDTIQVCLAFADMQREYAEVDRDGDGRLTYAGRFISTPGKHDGLYWPTKEGELPSPAGPRLAGADPKAKIKGGPTPYHGYYYRILTAQGKHAPGGAKSYLAGGKLIGGIALIAVPASYLASGVKTFTCNLDGVVYEKDLGPSTSSLAAKITAYDPDPSWAKAN